MDLISKNNDYNNHMTIRYIANARFPTEKAYGVHLAKMCEVLGNTGTEVELILPTRRNPIQHSVTEFYNIEQSFRLVWLKSADPRWLLALPAGTYIKGQAWFFLRKLKQYLSDNLKSDDVLYTRDEYLLPYLTDYSNRIISEVHNLPRRAEYYARFWNQCHKIIAISNGVKEDLIKAGVKKNKIGVLPDAVDVAMFDINISAKQARAKTNLPLDKKIALTNSSLYKWKGVYTLIESAKYLSDQWSVALVGGPAEAEVKLEQYIRKQNIPVSKIILAGHKHYELIPYYLKSADVLVLPASNDNDEKTNFNVKYTSPLKAFEYLVSGRPIVAADVPAVKEILNKKQALFYEPGNPQSLAKKIAKALSKKPSKIGNLNKYSWDHRAEQIIKLING